jgi:hypothetical protein
MGHTNKQKDSKMDYMLDEPEYDDEPLDSDDDQDYDEPDYDYDDEASANASSNWQNSRGF